MLARALVVILVLAAGCTSSKLRKALSPPQLPQCEAGYVLTDCNGQWTCMPQASNPNICAQRLRH